MRQPYGLYRWFWKVSRRRCNRRLSTGVTFGAIAVGLLIAGCGGSGGSVPGTRNTPVPTASPSPTPTPLPPPLATLSVDRAEVLRGQSATLSWNAQNATALVSSNFGAAVLSGNATVTPSETTTYALTVQNASGQTAIGSVVVRVAPVSVTVTPSPATLNVSDTLTFVARVSGAINTGVLWSVQEATGGSITTDGVYNAPTTAGDYHVQAVSRADASKSATVEVRVRAATGTVIVN